MTATIIDGKAVAQAIRDEVKAEVAQLRAQGKVPGSAFGEHVMIVDRCQQLLQHTALDWLPLEPIEPPNKEAIVGDHQKQATNWTVATHVTNL